MLALRQNARVIPLADRHDFFGLGRRNQIVERTKRAVAVAAKFGVRMMLVIENLKFHPDGRADVGLHPGLGVNGREIGLHENFDAAVAAGRGLEIRDEFKI